MPSYTTNNNNAALAIASPLGDCHRILTTPLPCEHCRWQCSFHLHPSASCSPKLPFPTPLRRRDRRLSGFILFWITLKIAQRERERESSISAEAAIFCSWWPWLTLFGRLFPLDRNSCARFARWWTRMVFS